MRVEIFCLIDNEDVNEKRKWIRIENGRYRAKHGRAQRYEPLARRGNNRVVEDEVRYPRKGNPYQIIRAKHGRAQRYEPLARRGLTEAITGW